MRNLDINEHLQQKEYDDNIFYNEMIYAKVNEGNHDLVLQFLRRVPNTDRKGNAKCFLLFLLLLLLSS